jgi:hypothetical protein
MPDHGRSLSQGDSIEVACLPLTVTGLFNIRLSPQAVRHARTIQGGSNHGIK